MTPEMALMRFQTRKFVPFAAGPPPVRGGQNHFDQAEFVPEPQGAVSVETTAHGRGSIATAHGIALGGEESSK